MALWGKKDGSALTGTASLENGNTIVVGTGTAFTTEVKIGDVVFLSTANTAPGTTTRYKVVAIANNTQLTLNSAYGATSNTSATVNLQQSPKDLRESYTGNSIANKRQIVGVDLTEAGVAANKANGLGTPGWHNYVAGSGGRSGRKQVECLVAMRSMTATVASDAGDDSVAADS